jgi:ferredoxin like protein
MDKLTDKLFTVTYKEDEGRPHIEIVDSTICGERCNGKYCTHFCPAGVYRWDPDQRRTLVSFGNCLECGACSVGCPYDNISCHAPRGGFGVQFKYG